VSNYFHNFPAFKPDTFYDQLQNRTDYELVSTADKEEGFPIPDALHSLGLLPQADYDHLLVSKCLCSYVQSYLLNNNLG